MKFGQVMDRNSQGEIVIGLLGLEKQP